METINFSILPSVHKALTGQSTYLAGKTYTNEALKFLLSVLGKKKTNKKPATNQSIFSIPPLQFKGLFSIKY